MSVKRVFSEMATDIIKFYANVAYLIGTGPDANPSVASLELKGPVACQPLVDMGNSTGPEILQMAAESGSPVVNEEMMAVATGSDADQSARLKVASSELEGRHARQPLVDTAAQDRVTYCCKPT